MADGPVATRAPGKGKGLQFLPLVALMLSNQDNRNAL